MNKHFMGEDTQIQIANKRVKRCSLLAPKEMQIKTIVTTYRSKRLKKKEK